MKTKPKRTKPTAATNAESAALLTGRVRGTCAALGDEHRMRVVLFLAGSPPAGRTVGEIEAHLGLSTSATLHHLGLMVERGILVRSPRGRHTDYRLATRNPFGGPPALAEAAELLRELVPQS